MAVRWQYPVFVVDISLDPFDLKTAGRPREYDDNELLELLDGKMRAGKIVQMMKEERGWPERQTYESLRRLKAAEKFDNRNRGGLMKRPKPLTAEIKLRISAPMPNYCCCALSKQQQLQEHVTCAELRKLFPHEQPLPHPRKIASDSSHFRTPGLAHFYSRLLQP